MFTASAHKKHDRRPCLKVCNHCHGKGLVANSFDTAQRKIYRSCDQCGKKNADSPFSLGIKLKCPCQDASASYDWLHAKDAKHFRSQVRIAAMEQLLELESSLSEEPPRQGLLLMCDCGAEYLCIDGPARRKLQGGASGIEEDKTHNKNIAKLLVENGILTTITLSPQKDS